MEYSCRYDYYFIQNSVWQELNIFNSCYFLTKYRVTVYTNVLYAEGYNLISLLNEWYLCIAKLVMF